jgi:hypothetical protein
LSALRLPFHSEASRFMLCAAVALWTPALFALGLNDGQSEQVAEIGDAQSQSVGQIIVWSERLPEAGTGFSTSSAVAYHGDETLAFGVMWTRDGLAMAYFEESSSDYLVTAMWAPVESTEVGMATLWSDGGCLFVETRKHTEGGFADESLWTNSTIGAVFTEVLFMDLGTADPYLPAAQREFRRNLTQRSDGSNEEIVWSVDYSRHQPVEIQSIMKRVETRFIESREILNRTTEFIALGKKDAAKPHGNELKE